MYLIIDTPCIMALSLHLSKLCHAINETGIFLLLRRRDKGSSIVDVDRTHSICTGSVRRCVSWKTPIREARDTRFAIFASRNRASSTMKLHGAHGRTAGIHEKSIEPHCGGGSGGGGTREQEEEDSLLKSMTRPSCLDGSYLASDCQHDRANRQ